MGPFIHNYNKSNLTYDVSEYIEKLIKNIRQGILYKKYSYQMWFLTNVMRLFVNYDVCYEKFNLLSDEEYQNILNATKQILNKHYYEYN